ncbi:hypothetical protein [Inquilinus limosus]|uniref:hypothetical protein n=1 Tax=Inquilinus limosus TaxID=171674 RepID=UPI0003FF38C9|nr:hypothetical protein [Inquilinus limosus]
MHIDVLDFAPAPARRAGLFARMRDAVARRVAERRQYNRIYDELLKLDRREMDELGIGPADFDAIARGTYRR